MIKPCCRKGTARCRSCCLNFGLKFADNIHYKFESSQASKARLQSSKRTGTKQNLTQNGSRSRSVSLSVCDVEVPWAYMLRLFLKFIYKKTASNLFNVV